MGALELRSLRQRRSATQRWEPLLHSRSRTRASLTIVSATTNMPSGQPRPTTFEVAAEARACLALALLLVPTRRVAPCIPPSSALLGIGLGISIDLCIGTRILMG